MISYYEIWFHILIDAIDFDPSTINKMAIIKHIKMYVGL